MHAAECDEPAVAAVGGHLAELIAVAGQVGQGDHLVLLIVVPEDQQPRPQLVADRLDAARQLVVGERLVGLEFEGGGGLEGLVVMIRRLDRASNGSNVRQAFQPDFSALGESQAGKPDVRNYTGS